MLPQFKPTVGFICEIHSPKYPGKHVISYVGKYGFTSGPYPISTAHSNEFSYTIYGLSHPVTGAILTNLKDMQQFYPEYFL